MPSKTSRRDAGSGGLYRDARGYWTAAVTLPDEAGKRRRKVVRSKDRVVAIQKLRALRAELDRAGNLPTSSPTLEQWLTTWLPQSARRVRPKTQYERERDVQRYLIPALGKIRLDRLNAAHVYRLHSHITDDLGLSSTTALRCHRLMSVALRDAVRAGRTTRNVATPEFTDAPAAAVVEMATLTQSQAITLLSAAARDERYGARWATSLLTGARVGEVLGIETDRVDWAAGTITLSWQLQRLIYEHGCDGACSGRRGADCPARTFRIPAGYESRRIEGGLHLVRPKTKTGWRVIPLVDPLAAVIAPHQEHNPSPGLLFTEPDGSPVDPSRDHKRWTALLAEAGVGHIRRHDARRTAVTLLLTLGIDEKVVQQIVGHSSVVMTRHYQHVNLDQARDALTRLGAHLALPPGGDVTG